jgi:hypothetical protein
MKQLRAKETEDAPQSSTRWTSRCHRPPGCENRRGGQGRHARPRAGGENGGGGRGRHTWPGSPPTNLTRHGHARTAPCGRRARRRDRVPIGYRAAHALRRLCDLSTVGKWSRAEGPDQMTGTSVDPGAASVLTVPDAPQPFHLLAKPTGAVCNLDCAYCFFLSKEMLYRARGSGWRTTCWRPMCGS